MAFVYWIHRPEHTDIFSQGYVGFTSKTVKSRFKKHCETLKYGRRKPTPLDNAIKKYGSANLIVQTMVEGTIDYCLMIEKKLRPHCKIGWNLGIGGDKPTIGRKATQAQRDHFSKVHSGRKHTEKWKKMMSEIFKGRKFRLGGKMPDISKNKIGEWSRNFKRTEQHKRNISNSLKGRRLSDEHRKKLSEAKSTCIHCGITANNCTISRWHGNRCKSLTGTK